MCCEEQVAQRGQPMSWITPLGLPVVQPYRRKNNLVVKTIMQDVLIADNDEQLPISIARQCSAFPPNFVHSLDSTHVGDGARGANVQVAHVAVVSVVDVSMCARLRFLQMLMTALDCHKRGLLFTAVHDSYWTHACDVDTMNQSLREQFVQLYSMPVLEQLRESLHLRFPTVSLVLVRRGTSVCLTG